MDLQEIQNKISPSVAIIIAGVIIAGAVLFAKNGSSVPIAVQPTPQKATQSTSNLEAMKPITSADHIRGDINAPVKIVEYSDTECPFCKQFQGTMKQIVADYGSQVAWVYRHFPLDSLHAKARKEAEATECAAELGGNDKFWAYLDRLMEITPSNDGLDPAELPKIATFVGLDAAKFNACLSSGKYAQKVEDQVQDAIATGGQGTPWSIVIGKNDKKYPLSGAQPYQNVKQLIETASVGK